MSRALCAGAICATIMAASGTERRMGRCCVSDQATAETCNRCGGENVIWSAPSPLWNRVMRGDDIDGLSQYDDLVCMTCFVILANEAGISGQWRLAVDPEPEGLIKVTPSGRTWDARRWLWNEAR